MKKAAYGSLRLKPDEFWSITLKDLAEMLEAVDADEADRFELNQRLIAWQTAHLMNVSGNVKKSVTVEKLLGKAGDDKSGDTVKVDRDEKNRKLQELKEKFNSRQVAT